MKKSFLLFMAMFAMMSTQLFADVPATDDIGYFYDSATGRFLSMGVASYHKRAAVADFYGLPFKIQNEGTASEFDGYTYLRLKLAQNTGKYLQFDASGIIINGTGYHKVSAIEKDGKILLRCIYTSAQVASAQQGWFISATADGQITLVENEADATQWEFIDGTAQKAIVAAATDARIAAEANKAGITAANQAALETALDEYSTSDLTSKINNPTMFSGLDGWTLTTNSGTTVNNGSYQIQNASPVQSTCSQTITGLNAGIYKVTVQAFYRGATMADCVSLTEAGYYVSNAFVKANDNMTQIIDWYSIRTSDSAPNSRGNFKDEFNEGSKYTNTVYAYVDNSGELDITIDIPSYIGISSGGDWICFNNVKLTYYYTKASVYQALTEAIAAARTECDDISTEARAAFDAEVADIEAAIAAETLEGDGSAERATIDAALINARMLAVKPGDDLTSKIVNPGFEAWSGWTLTKGESGDRKESDGKCVIAAYNHALDVEQTVTDLKPGFYKLKYQAFYRHRSNQTTWDMVVAGTVENLMTIYGNEQSKKAPLVTDYASETQYSSNCATITTADGTRYVPNGRASIVSAFFTQNYYNDELICVVDADGKLRIRVENTNTGNETYAAVSNFQLTFLGDALSDEDAAAILAKVPTDAMAADAQSALDDAVAAFQADASVTNYKALSTAITNAGESADAVKAYAGALAAAKSAVETENPMNADVKTAATTTYSTYENVLSFPTTAEYNVAVTALNSAVSNVNSSVGNYKSTKAAIDNVEAYLSRCEDYETALFNDNNGPAILAEVKADYEGGTMTSNRASAISTPYLVAAKAAYAGGTDITSQAPTSWTGATGNVAAWACPDAEGSPERYSSGVFTGDVMTMELTGLETGTYVVKMIGGASYTSGRGFAGATGQNYAYFFANDALQSLEVYDRSSIGAGTVECASLRCGVKDGTLKFGIQNITEGANWFVINLISISKISDELPATDVDLVIGESGYATFIAPFQYDLPSGIRAFGVSGVETDEVTLTLNEYETSVPANTPVVLQAAGAVNAVVSGVSEAASQNYKVGLLTGVYGDTQITDGYVLQKQGEDVKFYAVDAENPKTVPANHAFLSLPVGLVKAFGFDTITTAIRNIDVAKAAKNGAIYNLQGQQLGGLQKGVNIVDGKKVFVK